jgi:hypothetical protein
MFGMGSHDPFGHWKHKLWPKEGQESNWQFDFWLVKVENHPNFLACKWRKLYHRKDLDKGYNFALDLIPIGGLHAKLWAPKVVRILVVGILDFGPVAIHRVYYKGEVGGFP